MGEGRVNAVAYRKPIFRCISSAFQYTIKMRNYRTDGYHRMGCIIYYHLWNLMIDCRGISGIIIIYLQPLNALLKAAEDKSNLSGGYEYGKVEMHGMRLYS